MWNDKQKTKNQIRIGEMHGDIVQGSTIVDNSVHYTVLQDPADAICELKGDPAVLQKFMRNMDGSLEKSHALYPYYGVGIQEYEGENYLYSKALIPEAKERYPESVKGQFTITVPEGLSLDDYKRQSYISQTPIPIDKAVITKMLGDDPDPFQDGFQKEMSEAHFEIVPEPLPKPIECELGVSGWNDTYQLSYQIQPTDPAAHILHLVTEQIHEGFWSEIIFHPDTGEMNFSYKINCQTWRECRKFLEFEMAAVRGATMSIRVKKDDQELMSSVLEHSISGSSMKDLKTELDMIKAVMLVEAQYGVTFSVSEPFKKEDLAAIHFLADSIRGIPENCTWESFKMTAGFQNQAVSEDEFRKAGIDIQYRVLVDLTIQNVELKQIPIRVNLQNARLKDPDKVIADWKNAQLQEDKSIELEFVACSGKDKAIRIAEC
jgi:hypothetical protein